MPGYTGKKKTALKDAGCYYEHPGSDEERNEREDRRVAQSLREDEIRDARDCLLTRGLFVDPETKAVSGRDEVRTQRGFLKSGGG